MMPMKSVTLLDNGFGHDLILEHGRYLSQEESLTANIAVSVQQNLTEMFTTIIINHTKSFNSKRLRDGPLKVKDKPDK